MDCQGQDVRFWKLHTTDSFAACANSMTPYRLFHPFRHGISGVHDYRNRLITHFCRNCKDGLHPLVLGHAGPAKMVYIHWCWASVAGLGCSVFVFNLWQNFTYEFQFLLAFLWHVLLMLAANIFPIFLSVVPKMIVA